jgi:hypothetical protein
VACDIAGAGGFESSFWKRLKRRHVLTGDHEEIDN